MKRKTYLILMLFLFLTLSSCQKEEAIPTIIREGRQVAESFDDNFIIILYSEKDSYSNLEEVNLWGTIQYIGSEDSIDIYSGEPYAGFDVESEGVMFISFFRLTLLKTTTLNKGEVYEFPLRKSGGFSEDAEDADFWRDFYTEERMLFPIGEYQVTFYTDFYTDNDTDITLSTEYQFEVE
ncbi:MAG: hypothetical protein JXR62_04870 [Bacilli bacterium]|nr:hypothetical protein [Bacilli bacterium]